MATSKKVFVIDVARCNGCYNCQIVCKDEHVANDWSPIAKPQPEIGQFWLHLVERVRGTVPKVKVAYRPHLCMHCDQAPCLESCPVEGAIYKRDDGLVIIDAVKCTGCRNCVDARPYDTIFFNEDLNLAQKCTGCAHLLDDGWDEPRCADACPTLCLKWMDEARIKRADGDGRYTDYLVPRVEQNELEVFLGLLPNTLSNRIHQALGTLDAVLPYVGLKVLTIEAKARGFARTPASAAYPSPPSGLNTNVRL